MRKLQASQLLLDGIPGASNFRKIPGLCIYGVAQPTIRGIRNCIQALRQDTRFNLPEKILWLNLREEPLIYINDTPYVLRDQYLQLRNMNSYSGITPARLEMIEARLREDVAQELDAHDGRILVHSETDEQTVPRWVECPEPGAAAPGGGGVMTIREVMEDIASEGMEIGYFRVVWLSCLIISFRACVDSPSLRSERRTLWI